MTWALSIAGRTIDGISVWDERLRFKLDPVGVVSAHGGVAAAPRRFFRPVRLTGEVDKTDETTLRDYLNDLAADFTRLMPAKLIRVSDNRYLNCLIEEFGYRFEALRAPSRVAVLEMAAQVVDPFWYAPTESSTDKLGIIVSPTTWTVTNNGKVPTPTRIEATARIVNRYDVRITNVTKGETVRYKGTITKDKKATFNSRTKELRVNNINDLGNMEGFFWDLDVGANSLKYEGPLVTGVAAVLAAGGTLTVGTTYYYKITAIDSNGETIGSAEVSATPTTGNQTINLSWTAFSGATSYRVYRTTTSGSYPASSLIGSPSGTSLSDTGLAASAGEPPKLDITTYFTERF